MIKLKEIFAKEGPQYGPQNAIWFQTQGKLRGFVSIVNNKYQYEIINMITGKSIIRGDESSLSLAKKVIFKFFDKNKLTLKESDESDSITKILNSIIEQLKRLSKELDLKHDPKIISNELKALIRGIETWKRISF